MRIKLTHPIACPFGSGSAGQLVELPDHIALGLVAGGYAVQLDAPSVPPTIDEPLEDEHLADDEAEIEDPIVEPTKPSSSKPAKSSKKRK